MKIRTKRLLKAIGNIAGLCAILLIAALLCVGFVRACDFDRQWRKHAAERQLGSGAVCSDSIRDIVPCIKDNQPYQCIVGGQAACSTVDHLP